MKGLQTLRASDTVTDLPIVTAKPASVVPPVIPPTWFDRYKAWMKDKPWYFHLAAAILAMVVGALVKQYVPELAPYIPGPDVFVG